MGALLAEIFNSRPQQPKYCFIWNVQTVAEFIRKESVGNQELSEMFLAHKLTMLMAITSTSCALGLQHLNIRFMIKSNFTFTFYKLHKAWKKGNSLFSVIFYSFEEGSSLWVVVVLSEYLKRLKEWRTSDEWQLILSFVEPHTPFGSSTISRWIKKVLAISGVDVCTFKRHSTCSVSTSKAALSGLLMSDILARSSWSNS